jgi:hypothetical protein
MKSDRCTLLVWICTGHNIDQCRKNEGLGESKCRIDEGRDQEGSRRTIDAILFPPSSPPPPNHIFSLCLYGYAQVKAEAIIEGMKAKVNVLNVE